MRLGSYLTSLGRIESRILHLIHIATVSFHLGPIVINKKITSSFLVLLGVVILYIQLTLKSIIIWHTTIPIKFLPLFSGVVISRGKKKFNGNHDHKTASLDHRKVETQTIEVGSKRIIGHICGWRGFTSFVWNI